MTKAPNNKRVYDLEEKKNQNSLSRRNVVWSLMLEICNLK
jgi:hypothetical protein